jgi:undecaprenyl-diphosphatase
MPESVRERLASPVVSPASPAFTALMDETQELLREAFATPLVAALFLVVNGGLLFFGERLRRRAADDGATLAQLSWRNAISIGFWQCTALIPGISRSGATMVGGLRAGLSHEDAAHFSFLLATPIILGATVLEAPKLLRADAAAFGLPALVGLVVAGGVAYASIALLMRYFRTHEVSALKPFAYYCGALGLAAIALLAL